MNDEKQNQILSNNAQPVGLGLPSAVPVQQDHGQPAGSQLQSITPPEQPLGQTLASTIGTPQIADDADLIEKEWIEKAKEIVAQTSDDPHAQAREIQRFRADYIKKRYNKDIKVEEA